MKGRLELEQGAVVEYGGARYTITHVIDLHSVLARADDSKSIERLEIHALAEPHDELESDATPDVELSAISDEDWAEANRRAAIVRSILEAGGRRTDVVRAKARETGVHAGDALSLDRLL
jgi:putative transposase